MSEIPVGEKMVTPKNLEKVIPAVAGTLWAKVREFFIPSPASGAATNGLNRREFLEIVAKSTAGVLAGKLAPLSSTNIPFDGLIKLPQEYLVPELEVRPPGQNTLFIDFPLSFDSQELVRQALGLPFDQELLVTDPRQLPDSERFKTDFAYAAQYALLNYLAFFGAHGEMTTTSFQEFSSLWSSSHPERPAIDSLLGAVKIHQVERTEDGGLKIHLAVDVQSFAQQVAASDRIVVNASTIVGDFMVEYSFTGEAQPLEFNTFYHPQTDEPYYLLLPRPDLEMVTYMEMLDAEGNLILRTNEPQSREIRLLSQSEFDVALAEYNAQPVRAALEYPRLIVKEPYTEELGELARNNLLNLLEIAWDNPNKIIVTAAGNHNNFFYDLRQSIEADLARENKSWPENLVIVALYRVERFGGYAADGQDILVDYAYRPDFTETNDYLRGSSEATDVVSSIIDYLVSLGYDSETFREVLFGNPSQGFHGLTEWVTYNVHSHNPREGAQLLPWREIQHRLQQLSGQNQ